MVPFVRITDFLPPPVHRQVLEMAHAGLSTLVPAGTDYGGADAVRSHLRQAFVLPETPPFWSLFFPHLAKAVGEHGVAQVLGVDPARLVSSELQVTCHGDGAFFAPHVDSNPGAVTEPREVSFVYYFHTQPRRFTGGSLVLFDPAPGGAPARIDPADNSIILFSSLVRHEVEKVALPGNDLAHGRFTLNGWIRSDAPTRAA